MAAFLALLIERNEAVNLVSRRTAPEVVERQVLPSLAGLRVIPPGRALRVLDIGSGGGFPGIPLRILRPEARMDLVDATRNKCRFLEDCITELGWEDDQVHWCRIEVPTEDLTARAPFDLALARAVGDEDRIARAATRLVRPGGAGVWVFAHPGDGEPFLDSAGNPVTALRRIG
jgi:16S rRNA (guanine527-N7)-methyltransferase